MSEEVEKTELQKLKEKKQEVIKKINDSLGMVNIPLGGQDE